MVVFGDDLGGLNDLGGPFLLDDSLILRFSFMSGHVIHDHLC